MVTKNAIDSNIPIEIAKGGTNATTMATNTGIVKYDGTSLVTSSTALIDSSNRTVNSSQPAFSAYLSASVANVTGDGTTYKIAFNSEIFDQNSNFNTGTFEFTAPVTGKYLLCGNITTAGFLSGHTDLLIQLVTSNNNNQQLVRINPFNTIAIGNNLAISFSKIVDMDASDVSYINLIVSGSTKVVSIVGTSVGSSFTGCLLC